MNQKHEADAGRKIVLTASDGHTLDAWEAGSPNATRAIVVVQEIFGLTQHIRNVSARLAEHGYRVLAPALFDRAKPDAVLEYTQEGMKEGLDLRARIPSGAPERDVTAAAQALRDENPDRPVGILGFCWGGLVSWRAATEGSSFDAAISWYGGGIAGHVAQPPHCPTQLHFGGQDHFIPHTDIHKIREARPEVELFVYDDAGHGFGCPDRPGYDAEATELAWTRSLAFLDANLSKKDNDQ